MASFGELQPQLQQVQREIDALKKRGNRPARIPRALTQKLHALQAQLASCTARDVYRGDDGAAYYVRQIGGTFRWFGERADGAFANVLIGQRAANTVIGRWFDVPKGDRAQGGDLTLTVDDAAGTIAVVSQTGGFGATRFTLDRPCGPDAVPRADTARRRARYQAADPASAIQARNLTGTWMSDDHFFYVRELGGRVGWVGENRFDVHVFDGALSADRTRLDGTWVSVPKFAGATAVGHAVLSVDLGSKVQGPRMQVIEGTLPSQPLPGAPPPPPPVLDRVEALDVVIHLDALELLHGFPQRPVFVPAPPFEIFMPTPFGGFQPGHFELRPESSGDEPYLWTVFATIDGTTVRVENLAPSGFANVVSTSGSQNNLTPRENLPAGTVLPIPPGVGRFATTLITVRGLPASLAKDATTLIAGVIALEEEETNNLAMEAGRGALVTALGQGLNAAIRAGKAPDVDQLVARLKDAAFSAVKDETRTADKIFIALGLENHDSLVGDNHDVRTFTQLENAVRKESPDSLALSLPLLFTFPPPPEANPSYFVNGQIDIVASRILGPHDDVQVTTTTTPLTG